MKRPKIIIHIVLWLVYLLTYALLWNNPHFSFLKNLMFEVSQLPFKLVLVYSALYFADNFLFKKRYIRFLVTVACISFADGVLHQCYMYFIVSNFFPELCIKCEALWDWGTITKRMTFLNTPMLIAVTLTVMDKYYLQKEINARISNEKLSAELQLLKNQFHPHFFFNTLNNLYSLTLQKSDLAPAMVLKLSDLMRYTLDQADKEKVRLKDELEFIKNYVAIEEIRYKERVLIIWELSLTKKELMVPPLMLVTFIENAFKHSVAKALNPVTITIKLYYNEGWLKYTVINTIPQIDTTEFKNNNDKAAMGLNNLKQRLELIYKRNYTFKITEGSSFEAYLSIPVSDENI